MKTVLDSLNTGLHRAFAGDERVVLLGEDVLDPYGGAFKVTRGLSTAFPGRVLTTPISEAAIVGVAAGLALRGLRPIVEIMFGDFLPLTADQLVNHVAKFQWMYNEQVQVPLVIRTPMGGRRGYGPTHSQTLEKMFLGLPGLRVLAPAPLMDPGDLLYRAVVEDDGPILFVENKLLYLLPILENGPDSEAEIVDLNLQTGPVSRPDRSGFHREAPAPSYLLRLRGAPAPSLTIAAYGYMAELARQAVWTLAYEHEVFAELVVPTQLAPFDRSALLASVRNTGRLITAEEGTQALGWGAEAVAQSAEALGPRLRSVCRVAARLSPVPASQPLESAVLPGVEDVVRAALDMV